MSFRPELTVEDDPKDGHKQVDGNAFWEHKSIESYNEFNTNCAKSKTFGKSKFRQILEIFSKFKSNSNSNKLKQMIQKTGTNR